MSSTTQYNTHPAQGCVSVPYTQSLTAVYCGCTAQAAEALADPQQYPNLFPNLEEALRAEKMLGEG